MFPGRLAARDAQTHAQSIQAMHMVALAIPCLIVMLSRKIAPWVCWLILCMLVFQRLFRLSIICAKCGSSTAGF